MAEKPQTVKTLPEGKKQQPTPATASATPTTPAGSKSSTPRSSTTRPSNTGPGRSTRIPPKPAASAQDAADSLTVEARVKGMQEELRELRPQVEEAVQFARNHGEISGQASQLRQDCDRLEALLAASLATLGKMNPDETNPVLKQFNLQRVQGIVDQLDAFPTFQQELVDLTDKLTKLDGRVKVVEGETELLRTDINEHREELDQHGTHINLVVQAHNALDTKVGRLRTIDEKFPWVKFVIAGIVGVIVWLAWPWFMTVIQIPLKDGSWTSLADAQPVLASWPAAVLMGVSITIGLLGLLVLMPSRANAQQNVEPRTTVEPYQYRPSAIPPTTTRSNVTSSPTADAEAPTEPLPAQGASSAR